MFKDVLVVIVLLFAFYPLSSFSEQNIEDIPIISQENLNTCVIDSEFVYSVAELRDSGTPKEMIQEEIARQASEWNENNLDNQLGTETVLQTFLVIDMVYDNVHMTPKQMADTVLSECIRILSTKQ